MTTAACADAAARDKLVRLGGMVVATPLVDGTWTSGVVEGLDGVLDLPRLELSLPMPELCEDVEPEPAAVAQNV